MLLSKMLDSIGLGEEDVLIFNLIPWRPPGDRAPYAQELEICRPFGNRLIEIVKPDAMLIFGNYPARALLRSTATIHSLRGKWHEIACGSQKIPAVTTFHPQELIATPLNKRLAWQDLLLFSTLLTH
jgi:DNA polymerase